MNIQEMHLAIRMGIDKVNSMYLDNLLPEEIDLMLNKAQSAFIKQRLNPMGNRYGKGYDQNQKRIDDVRTLVTESTHYPAYDYKTGINIMTGGTGPWDNDINGNQSTLAELGCLFFAGIAGGADQQVGINLALNNGIGGTGWDSPVSNIFSNQELTRAKEKTIYADALFLPSGHNKQPLDQFAETKEGVSLGWPVDHYYEHMLSVTVSTANYRGQHLYPGFHWAIAPGTQVGNAVATWPDMYRVNTNTFADIFNMESTTDPFANIDGFDGFISPYIDGPVENYEPENVLNPVNTYSSYDQISAASYISHDDLQKTFSDPFNTIKSSGPRYTFMDAFNFAGTSSALGGASDGRQTQAAYFGAGVGSDNNGGFYTDDQGRTLEGPRHDCLVLFSDSTFIYNWVKITYIRRAAEMLNGQVRAPQVDDVSCELPIHTHWEIVNMAIDSLLEGFADPRYKTHSVETAKSE